MILVVITQEIGIEPFLINELNHIKTQFSKIFIITAAESQYRFPDATTIISKKTDYFISCFLYSVSRLFSKEALQELKDRKKMREKPTFVKMFFTMITCWMIEKRFQQYFKAIPKEEPIILYSYWINQYAYCVAKTKQKHPQIIAVSRAHGFEVRDFADYIPFRRFIDSYLDKIVFISEYTMNEYNKILSKITNKTRSLQKVIKLGIVNQSANLQKLHSKDRPYLIVSCSGIYKIKRIDIIINSLSILPKSIFINWVHFGSGSDLQEISSLAKEKLSLSNFSFDFKGDISNSDIFKFYETENVLLFINMSDYEGIPVSIMEAISFGIPCIARNVGGNGEIVQNNVSGILLPNQVSPNEVAEAIHNFLNNIKNNPKYYEDLRKSTHYFWAQNYDSFKNFQNFVEYIKSKN